MEDNKKELGAEDVVTDADGATLDDVNADAAAESEAAEAEAQGKSAKSDKKKIKKLESENNELSKKLEKAEAEITEANDKYTRLFAEFDNYKKRTAKEKEGMYTDAYADALAQILPIFDNFERALQYKDAEGGSENMARGLEMIQKSFAEAFEKMGVKEIEALGKTFDPELHNAVMHIEDESLGENEVAEVFMKGYQRGDRVLRHSMVKVAN